VAIEIKGSYLEELFNLIGSVYSKHGFERRGWSGWPSLNEYYPSHLAGNFIVTDENNYFEEFRSSHGSHPALGGGLTGDHSKAWPEFVQVLGLELADDLDGYNMLTYRGHRKRYWLITNPRYSGGFPAISRLSERPRDVADVVSALTQLSEQSNTPERPWNS
jgi:hypothetical protein